MVSEGVTNACKPVDKIKESGKINDLPILHSFITSNSESQPSRKSYEKSVSLHV
jgi:hypothetical protein